MHGLKKHMFPGFGLYSTDPARHISTAGWNLVEMYGNIVNCPAYELPLILSLLT